MIGQRNLTLSHLNPLREFSLSAEIGSHDFVSIASYSLYYYFFQHSDQTGL